nr:hypothetical protein [Lacticaseibacillus paracasei]
MESEVDDVYISQVTGEPVYVDIKGTLLKRTDLQFIPGPSHGFLLMKSKVDHGLSSLNQRSSITAYRTAKKKR